jgi:RNA polymerase sigma-B factor
MSPTRSAAPQLLAPPRPPADPMTAVSLTSTGGRVRAQTLSDVDATELVARWQQHRDRAAREELCERFLPLARKLAARYRNAQDPQEDLIQVACVGLLGAIERFDPQRGVNFASFALPTMLGEIKRYFRNTGWTVHVPRGAQELALRVDRGSREIALRTGRSPRLQDLAEYLEMPAEDVLIGLDARAAHYSDSLDAPAASADADDPQSLADALGSEDDRLGLVEMKLSLATAIARLPYLERRALALRVRHDMKQIDIGTELGCSQMQVSRLLNRARDKLRMATEADRGPRGPV